MVQTSWKGFDVKILIVASYNKGRFALFIMEQVDALKSVGCEVHFFTVHGKGIKGYLRNLSALKSEIRAFCPDVVHAHYGLSGLLANLQRKVPVVTTYHGSDINEPKVLRFSKIAMRLSAWNIFVSKKTLQIAKLKQKYTLLPCGIDLCGLQLTEKKLARQYMNLSADKEYILFAGAFDNAVKNAPLAKQTVELLNCSSVEMLQLNGYSRDEVTFLMCAADVFLMTSLTEGSPQVIKEAMACGCPVVSVDVGDVKERTEGVEGCFVAQTSNPQELSDLILKALRFGGRTEGRKRIIADGLENHQVANKLMEIYQKVCQKK